MNRERLGLELELRWRCTGLKPSEYRRMFRPIATVEALPSEQGRAEQRQS